MPRYITTNVRFPPADYRDLQLRAGRRRLPVASLVREAVAEYLSGPGRDERMREREDPVDRLIGAAPGGPRDEALNHDHYLYGWPKERPRETAGGHRGAARAVQPARPAA